MMNGNADNPKHRILILGGTGDARRLAATLVARGHDVVSSLAGRTSTPHLPQGKVRIGGFGGAKGLAHYLRQEQIDQLIDATHPFAAQISTNAVAASVSAQVPLIRLERPVWEKPQKALWQDVADMDAAADALPTGAHGLLTIGRQDIAAFFSRSDCRFTARMIEPPETVPAHWSVLFGIGPYSVEAEIDLLKSSGITHLVSKNSGGPGVSKLMAAAQLGLPTVMVSRPVLPKAPVADSIDSIIAMLA